MNVIVTCGPGYEPIDEARRLTNMSTGTLGVSLANHLSSLGHIVHCFKGEMASTQIPLKTPHSATFSTNDVLLEKLRALPAPEKVDAVFHAAALCDFKVASITNPNGDPLKGSKIATRDGGMTLHLEPTVKILPLLKTIFPGARIVGWKYELEGDREDAFASVRRQLAEYGSFACVLNGAAYGPGFAICRPNMPPVERADTKALLESLTELISH